MYRHLIRPILFLLDEELVHKIILRLLQLLYLVPGAGLLVRGLIGSRVQRLPVTVMNLEFPNPVGLAAGLDKNGCCIRGFSDMGFGWVEVGTVTPVAQPGNPGKRIFRLESHQAIINRMGFPSAGVDRFLRNMRLNGRRGLVGINIGKNATTPLQRANEDYLAAFREVYSYADYITINISSPNTSGLRDMQKGEALNLLLAELKNEQRIMTRTRQHYVPIAVKVAPDLDDIEIDDICDAVLKHKIDAVIATNTSTNRPGLEEEAASMQAGGLSGPPIRDLSTQVIRKFFNRLKGKVPIIGAGGINDASDAWDKMVAGADLVQIYTSFIYEGPAVIRRINRGLYRRQKAAGVATFREVLDKARSGVHLMR